MEMPNRRRRQRKGTAAASSGERQFRRRWRDAAAKASAATAKMPPPAPVSLPAVRHPQPWPATGVAPPELVVPVVLAALLELRVVVGDDSGGDKFVIGTMGAAGYSQSQTWTPKFSVETNGAVRAAGTITASTTPDLAETIPAAADVETAARGPTARPQGAAGRPPSRSAISASSSASVMSFVPYFRAFTALLDVESGSAVTR